MTKLNETRGTRWLVPISALVIGAGLAAIQLARGQTWDAVWFFGIMLGYAVILTVLSSRSELVALLRGDTADERRTLIHLRASSASAR